MRWSSRAPGGRSNCAGLIGYRTWRLAGGGNNANIGIYGFGAAAHILAQVARHAGQSIYAFTRPGDHAAQQLARELGAAWAGGSDEAPPVTLDAALVFAPVGDLMVAALEHVDRGGSVVSGGIHMSDIPAFPYSRLWQERSLKSVANLTRQDGRFTAARLRRAVATPPYPARTSRTGCASAQHSMDRTGEIAR